MGILQKKCCTTGKKALTYRGKGRQNTDTALLALRLGVVLYLLKNAENKPYRLPCKKANLPHCTYFMHLAGLRELGKVHGGSGAGGRARDIPRLGVPRRPPDYSSDRCPPKTFAV